MEQQSLVLITSGTLSGLLAGLYLAFSIAVIPSLRDIPAKQHIFIMQRINIRILNLPFLVMFIGPAILLPLAAYLPRDDSPFPLLALAAALHILGNLGITIGGNVPLNSALDALDVAQLSDAEAEHIRNNYQGVGARWMILHHIRTTAITLATVLIFIAALSD